MVFGLGSGWLGSQDSNLGAQLQRLVCCHYTTPQCGASRAVVPKVGVEPT